MKITLLFINMPNLIFFITLVTGILFKKKAIDILFFSLFLYILSMIFLFIIRFLLSKKKMET